MKKKRFLQVALVASMLLSVSAVATQALDHEAGKVFFRWLRGFEQTYTVEVHGFIPTDLFELPEIPLCVGEHCETLFDEASSYRLAMVLDVPNDREVSAKRTRVTLTLIRINASTGERTTLGKISKKVKELPASKGKNFFFSGIESGDQIVAVVKFKKGMFSSGAIVEITVALARNEP